MALRQWAPKYSTQLPEIDVEHGKEYHRDGGSSHLGSHERLGQLGRHLIAIQRLEFGVTVDDLMHRYQIIDDQRLGFAAGLVQTSFHLAGDAGLKRQKYAQL